MLLTTNCIISFFLFTEFIDLSPRLLFSPHHHAGEPHYCPCDDDDFFVHVWALPFVPNATQVHVEPCSPTDWHLMQQNAAWLEGGEEEDDGRGSDGAAGLLHQVSIVYPGQVLSLCVPQPPAATSSGRSVSGSTSDHCRRIRMVQLRVLSCSTKGIGSTMQHRDQIWPSLDDDDDDDDDSHHSSQENDDDRDDHEAFCCFRLVQDTEVIVAPYQEPDNSSTTACGGGHVVLSLYPTLQDYYADGDMDDGNNGSSAYSATAAVKILADRLRHVIDNKDTTSPQRQRQQQVSLLTSTHVPPCTALVHPTVLSRLLQQAVVAAAAPIRDNHDNGGAEELLVQLRAVPSWRDDDIETMPTTPRSPMMVVQLQESNDVPEDRIGKFNVSTWVCMLFSLFARECLFVCLFVRGRCTIPLLLFCEDPNHANTKANNTSNNV
jgi:hypothetical protein